MHDKTQPLLLICGSCGLKCVFRIPGWSQVCEGQGALKRDIDALDGRHTKRRRYFSSPSCISADALTILRQILLVASSRQVVSGAHRGALVPQMRV